MRGPVREGRVVNDLVDPQKPDPQIPEMPPPTGGPVLRQAVDTPNGVDADDHHGLLRLCRHCSTESKTQASRCPVCGTPYVHEPWWRRPWLWASAAVAVLVAGMIVGVLLWNNHQTQVAEEQRIAAEQDAAAREAAQQEAAARAAREAAAAAIAEREAVVPQIERSITKMARKHAREGLIEGWPKTTECSPAAGQSVENLNRTTTSFSCFVITERHQDGTSSGHNYHALMNWDSGSWTYGYGDT